MSKNKIKQFFISVAIGIVKATPFGHIATEIDNNLKHQNGGKGQIDKVRFYVWIVVTLLLIAKSMNLITWNDFGKFIQFILDVTK